MFLNEFVSMWFHFYTIALAGERLEKVSTTMQRAFLSVYYSPLYHLIQYFAAFYILSNFVDIHRHELDSFTKQIPFYGEQVKASVFAIAFKLGVNFVEMKQSVLRILEFDSEERYEDKCKKQE